MLRELTQSELSNVAGGLTTTAGTPTVEFFYPTIRYDQEIIGFKITRYPFTEYGVTYDLFDTKYYTNQFETVDVEPIYF